MKISVNWLKQYIQLTESVAEISDLLTMSGLEVEGVAPFEEIPGSLAGLVIGEVKHCEKHPEADRLSITKVDIGADQPVQIICGAPNVATGQKVVVATVGATVNPINGDSFKIKRAKIRGEVSEGMICAEDEIGIGTDHSGILVLDTQLPVGSPANDHFETSSDQVIEIGLTPNRSDAISHIGVARDLKALLNRPLKWPPLDPLVADQPSSPIQIEVENFEACPRYSGLCFQNVSIEDSPRWLQNRLRAIGLSPINNIVDITNFVMHEMGQPMHAFDADAIKGNKVIVKTLPKGTPFTTLDEKERKLQDFDLMICDGEENGMCIAGVFGGIKSGVTENTTSIFLESAHFSADYVRKSSLYHSLKTDASFRFERGTDPNLTVTALIRAAHLIKELAGATIQGDIIDIYPEEIRPCEVQVSYKNVDRLIGQPIPSDTVIKILEDLDFKIEQKSQDGFMALVPTYRTEVNREADIIEEILRIYGYNNIEVSDHYGSDYLADFPEIDADRTRFGLAKMLAAQGFYEIYTNSLTKPDYVHDNPDFEDKHNVEILNKLSEDLGVLRQTLLFTGLESLAHNINHRQVNLKLFEFGKTYRMLSNDANQLDRYAENMYLSLFLTGKNQDESWMSQTREVEFHDLSAVIHKILEKFNLSAYNSRVINSGIFEYGLSITVAENTLAQFGKLTASVCSQAEIKQPVFYAEVDWEALLQLPKDDIKFKEVAKYPEVRRDLSLVLDKSVTFSEIEKLARSTERQILRSINVFDVYQGDKIGAGKKAYALSFILQDNSKTLTDKIIDKCMSRLMRSFEENLGAFIRT